MVNDVCVIFLTFDEPPSVAPHPFCSLWTSDHDLHFFPSNCYHRLIGWQQPPSSPLSVFTFTTFGVRVRHSWPSRSPLSVFVFAALCLHIHRFRCSHSPPSAKFGSTNMMGTTGVPPLQGSSIPLIILEYRFATDEGECGPPIQAAYSLRQSLYKDQVRAFHISASPTNGFLTRSPAQRLSRSVLLSILPSQWQDNRCHRWKRCSRRSRRHQQGGTRSPRQGQKTCRLL